MYEKRENVRKWITKVKCFCNCLKYTNWAKNADTSDAKMIFETAVEVQEQVKNSKLNVCVKIFQEKYDIDLRKCTEKVLEIFLFCDIRNDSTVFYIIDEFCKYHSKDYFNNIVSDLMNIQLVKNHLVKLNINFGNSRTTCLGTNTLEVQCLLLKLLQVDESKLKDYIYLTINENSSVLLLSVKNISEMNKAKVDIITKNILDLMKEKSHASTWKKLLNIQNCQTIKELILVNESFIQVVYLFLDIYSGEVECDMSDNNFKTKWSHSGFKYEDVILILKELINHDLFSYILKKVQTMSDPLLFWSDLLPKLK